MRYTFDRSRLMILRKFSTLIVMIAFLGCQDDDNVRQNPFLVDISFQVQLNTNLPQYSQLNFAQNAVLVPNAGLRGVVVYHQGNEQYRAWELSDPNHSPSDCSRMRLDGTQLTCPCSDDENSYDIILGLPLMGEGEYGLKSYRVNRSGDIITVSN